MGRLPGHRSTVVAGPASSAHQVASLDDHLVVAGVPSLRYPELDSVL